MKNSLNTAEKKQLLDLYLKGELRAELLDEFLNFLQTEEGKELLKQDMDQTGFSSGLKDEFTDKSQSNRIYRQVNLRINQSPKHFRLIARIAATFLLLVALGGGIFYMMPFHSRSAGMTIQVSADRQQTVVLPDGTHVRLNTGSRLLYPSDMNEREKRQVTLTGEAFFEVAKNPDKPFLIDAGEAEVKVLGTVFNVKTTSRKNEIVVAVQEGKVLFKGKEKDRGVILTANQVGTWKEKDGVTKVDQPAQNYFSWFEHFLEFDNVPLPRVVEQLEIIFDTDIELLNPDLNDKHFTAYMRGASVDEVMNQLALSLELKLEKIDGKYLLR
jgi:ferric-dicitrate binding protein FerR (iron transport regulator)